MRPTTVRRLLVFAVCAFGVGALYWAPSLAGTPGQVPQQAQPQPVRTIRNTVTASPTSTSIGTAAPTGATDPGAQTTTEHTSSGPYRTVTPISPQRPDRSPRAGSTPRDPSDQSDRTRPDPVPDVTVIKASNDDLTVTWSKANDDRGVVSYRVLLNGFEALSTRDLRATLPWFNDDGEVNTVQVCAVDAAGNLSHESPTVLASKPATSASPTPDPSTTPDPSPTPGPSTPGPTTPDPSTTPDPNTTPDPSTTPNPSTTPDPSTTLTPRPTPKAPTSKPEPSAESSNGDSSSDLGQQSGPSQENQSTEHN